MVVDGRRRHRADRKGISRSRTAAARAAVAAASGGADENDRVVGSAATAQADRSKTSSVAPGAEAGVIGATPLAVKLFQYEIFPHKMDVLDYSSIIQHRRLTDEPVVLSFCRFRYYNGYTT